MGAGEIAPDPRAGVHGSKSLCCNATKIRDILCSEHPERCRIIALLSYHELFGNAAMPPPSLKKRHVRIRTDKNKRFGNAETFCVDP